MPENNVGTFIRIYFSDSCWIDVEYKPAWLEALKTSVQDACIHKSDTLLDFRFASLDGTGAKLYIRASKIDAFAISTPESRLSTHRRDAIFDEEEEAFKNQAGSKPNWMEGL